MHQIVNSTHNICTIPYTISRFTKSGLAGTSYPAIVAHDLLLYFRGFLILEIWSEKQCQKDFSYCLLQSQLV